MKFVEFNIGKEHFGINIGKVKYIEQFHEITHVPDVPQHIEGVINLHGEIIPVYNLHEKFDLNHIDFTDDTVFIIIDIDNISMAIIADDVSEIVDSEDYEM